MLPPPYIAVTPTRNETDNITHTIESMAAQSLRPAIWVMVDNGSTDETPQIIDVAAQQHPWIWALHRSDRGFRKQGGGVVETFYAGFERFQGESWGFLVKFDADLSFESDYFERCLAKFATEPKLGMGGGLVCGEMKLRRGDGELSPWKADLRIPYDALDAFADSR